MPNSFGAALHQRVIEIRETMNPMKNPGSWEGPSPEEGLALVRSFHRIADPAARAVLLQVAISLIGPEAGAPS